MPSGKMKSLYKCDRPPKSRNRFEGRSRFYSMVYDVPPPIALEGRPPLSTLFVSASNM